MPSSQRLPKRLASGVLATALGLHAATAQAEDDTATVALGVVTLGGLTAADIAFGIHGAQLYVQRGEPDREWAIAELAIGAPQTVFLQAFTHFLVHERGDHVVKLIMPAPTMVVTAIGIHGAWSLARPDESPSLLFVGSSMIAVNGTWTAMRLSNLLDGELRPWEIGWAQMLSTGPMVAWGAAEAARQQSFRTGWIGMTLWSSALFMHGAAGVLIGDDGNDSWDSIARKTAATVGMQDVSVVPGVTGALGPAAGLTVGGVF